MTDGGESHFGMLVCGRFAELEDALVERVRQLRAGGGPLSPLTVVVGSGAVRTRVGDLLVRRLEAVANVDVVTLAGLARDLVAEGEAPPGVLAGLARERFLRRLIDRDASNLRYFGPVVERPRFAHALAATFADLRQALVPSDSPWAEAVAVASGGVEGGRGKAADLDRLYRAYCAGLASDGLLDDAGVLVAAAAVVSGSRRAKPILYGIYDLNQAQEAFFRALVGKGADVFVPVPRGGSREGAASLTAALDAGLSEERWSGVAGGANRGGDADRDTAVKRAGAADHSAGIADRSAGSADDAAAGEHANLPDRERLAAVWLSRSAPVAGEALRFSGDGTLEVVSVPDERAETREAVRAVITALESGTPAWDCAVVVPHEDDIERVAAALAAAAPQPQVPDAAASAVAKLPVACRLPDRSLGTRLLLRLAECVAPAAGEPFARRAVVDLLTAVPLKHTDASPGEMALWLDEARQAGVVGGLEEWTDRVGRRLHGLRLRVADVEGRPAGQEEGDESAGRLESVRLRLRAAQQLDSAATALRRACGGLPASAGWSRWADVLDDVVGALFCPEAAAAAGDVIGRLRSLSLVDEEVELVDAAATLRELLGAGRVPVGRVGRDGVAVVTPLALRGLSFGTVVFTGLAEGGFPARGRPDPILGDGERRRIAHDLTVRLPLAEQRDADSLLLFAFACEAARERLVLLAPRTEAATGRPRLPSRLLLRLASLAAGRPVGLDELLGGRPLAPVWRHAAGVPSYVDEGTWVDSRERDTATLLSLSDGGRRSAALTYLAAVLGQPGAAERRIGAWRASRSPESGAWDGLLGDEARAALAARHPFDAEMHPTRLERYVGCPFGFLLRDVFRLEAPEEPGDSLEMDARELGIVVHEILQLAYERVIAEDLGLEGALAAVASAWETGCASAERRGVTGAGLSWEVRRETLLEDLLDCVRRDPVFAHGDGRPVGVEWRFGEAAGRPVALELEDGRRVRFAGRLDRVDATPAGARVIDYKTGAGTTERQRIKDRLSVQLPVYQLAVRQAAGGDHAAITCLYRLVTRRGGFADLPLAETEDDAGERLRELVSSALSLVDAGMFPRTTRGRCELCDVRYACGTSAWARARKREQEALEPVVELQGPQAKGGRDDA